MSSVETMEVILKALEEARDKGELNYVIVDGALDSKRIKLIPKGPSIHSRNVLIVQKNHSERDLVFNDLGPGGGLPHYRYYFKTADLIPGKENCNVENIGRDVVAYLMDGTLPEGTA